MLSTQQTCRLLRMRDKHLVPLLLEGCQASPVLEPTAAARQAAPVPHPAEAWSAAERAWQGRHSRQEQETLESPLVTCYERPGFTLAQWKPRRNHIAAEGPGISPRQRCGGSGAGRTAFRRVPPAAAPEDRAPHAALGNQQPGICTSPSCCSKPTETLYGTQLWPVLPARNCSSSASSS